MNGLIRKSQPPEKVNVYKGPYHWYLPQYFDFVHRTQLNPVLKTVPTTAKILELGAGDGRLTHLLARNFQFVVGLEVQRTALRFAHLMMSINGTAPILVEGDAARLPFRNDAFDCVVACDVIEHLPPDDAMRMLESARHVLSPGGWILVTTPNRRSLRNRVWGQNIDPKHYFEFDADQLKAALQNAGFGVVSVEGLCLTPPIPRIEHFASVVPFRRLFRGLVRAGRRYPRIADRLIAIARRPGNDGNAQP